MPESRNERIARNEASYRELNEAIHSGSPAARRFQLICECGHPECTAPLNISADEYAAVRAHPRRFLVLAGHEIADAEEVVDRQPGYFVIQKPTDVAHIVDPGGEAS